MGYLETNSRRKCLPSLCAQRRTDTCARPSTTSTDSASFPLHPSSADTPLLLSILSRLTSIPTTSPLVLIGGLPYSLNEFDGIYKDGWLNQLLVQAGATLGTQQKKREEKERLMRIAMQKIKAASLPEEDDEWY